MPLDEAVARFGEKRLRAALVRGDACATGVFEEPNAPPKPAGQPVQRGGIPAALWTDAAICGGSCVRLASGALVRSVIVLATQLERGRGGHSSPLRRNNDKAAAAHAWMLAHITDAGCSKREIAIRDCMVATGCTRAAARAAWNALPPGLRNPRGRPQKRAE